MKRREITPPTDEEILAYDCVPPDVASRYIQMSTPTIYAGLQQERLPFGVAVFNSQTNTWTYNISPGGLVKYKREGKPIIRLGELREMMADSAKEVLDAKMQGLSRVMQAVMEAQPTPAKKPPPKGRRRGGWDMTTEQVERLEAALLSFVEHAVKGSATAEEMQALPAVARVLFDFSLVH